MISTAGRRHSKPIADLPRSLRRLRRAYADGASTSPPAADRFGLKKNVFVGNLVLRCTPVRPERHVLEVSVPDHSIPSAEEAQPLAALNKKNQNDRYPDRGFRCRGPDEVIAVTARLRRSETLPDPNEIARRIESLWPDGTADELDLRKALEVASLLRMMMEVHGYKGDRYDHFAEQRGINRADAYVLYHLGAYADRVIKEHAASDMWPHWREVARQLGLSKPRNDTTAALRQDRDKLAAKVKELEAEVADLRQQQPSRSKHGPGGGYILIPPDLIPSRRFPEFVDAFDPFPHPLPTGWDGLTMPWQRMNVINAPFRRDDNTQRLGLTYVVRKAIAEQAKGNTSLMFIPSTAVVNLLAEALAHKDMVPLGRLRWLHYETREPWPMPGETTAFILRGLAEQ